MQPTYFRLREVMIRVIERLYAAPNSRMPSWPELGLMLLYSNEPNT
jgi:hypothetical protein